MKALFSSHRRVVSCQGHISNCPNVVHVGRFICTAEFPYGVMYANKSWTRLTGYQQHEIEGKDMCFMQGALTDTVSVIQVPDFYDFNFYVLNFRVFLSQF